MLHTSRWNTLLPRCGPLAMTQRDKGRLRDEGKGGGGRFTPEPICFAYGTGKCKGICPHGRVLTADVQLPQEEKETPPRRKLLELFAGFAGFRAVETRGKSVVYVMMPRDKRHGGESQTAWSSLYERTLPEGDVLVRRGVPASKRPFLDIPLSSHRSEASGFSMVHAFPSWSCNSLALENRA